MNNEKDKYEIVRSFQNLLKKAEQLIEKYDRLMASKVIDVR